MEKNIFITLCMFLSFDLPAVNCSKIDTNDTHVELTKPKKTLSFTLENLEKRKNLCKNAIKCVLPDFDFSERKNRATGQTLCINDDLKLVVNGDICKDLSQYVHVPEKTLKVLAILINEWPRSVSWEDIIKKVNFASGISKCSGYLRKLYTDGTPITVINKNGCLELKHNGAKNVNKTDFMQLQPKATLSYIKREHDIIRPVGAQSTNVQGVKDPSLPSNKTFVYGVI